MQLFLAALLCVVIIVVIVAGEIYMSMDKFKARAIVMIRKMTKTSDVWVEATVKLIESAAGKQSAEEAQALSSRYFGMRKYKEMPEKITLVNSLAALACPFAETAAGSVAGAILTERADAADSLVFMRNDYNDCVRKLNKRLGKKIPGAIGNLFRIKKLEELRDLRDA